MGRPTPPLTAEIEGSFAYFTVRDRLPVILTRVIDHLCREKFTICEDYGQEVKEEIKEIVGQLSQLKNEMQTDKPFKKLSNSSETVSANDDDDDGLWNAAFQSYWDKHGDDPKWFAASWLFTECYLYKRIHHIFLTSKSLKCYDPFHHQKSQSCKSALEAIKYLSEYVMKEVIQSPNQTTDNKKKILLEMLEISVWGNQYDLSISGGAVVSQENNPFSMLEEMRENIIVSHQEPFWECLNKIPEDKRQIALILDNAGLELVADLCLATILIKFKFVSSLVFYTKTRPWFVSDTTLRDLNWTLNYLQDQDGNVAKLNQIFSSFLENGSWKVREHKFWTGPQDFSEMKKVDPMLYKELSQYSLIIFKGDLNYRKLVGDLDWPNETSFKTAVRGFLPSSMLVLRTLKGGPVVGLDETSPKVLKAKLKENWNTSGEIGMIQFIRGSSVGVKELSILVVTGVSILIISIFLKRFIF